MSAPTSASDSSVSERPASRPGAPDTPRARLARIDRADLARIALVEEGLAATQGGVAHFLLEGHLLSVVKAAEERDLADEVSVTDHLGGSPFCSCPAVVGPDRGFTRHPRA